MIKHIIIWWVIIKHEKYEKHNIKIKYENKRNNRNRNYEIIINVRIDKQSIDVREKIKVIVNVKMRERR